MESGNEEGSDDAFSGALPTLSSSRKRKNPQTFKPSASASKRVRQSRPATPILESEQFSLNTASVTSVQAPVSHGDWMENLAETCARQGKMCTRDIYREHAGDTLPYLVGNTDTVLQRINTSGRKHYLFLGADSLEVRGDYLLDIRNYMMTDRGVMSVQCDEKGYYLLDESDEETVTRWHREFVDHVEFFGRHVKIELRTSGQDSAQREPKDILESDFLDEAAGSVLEPPKIFSRTAPIPKNAHPGLTASGSSSAASVAMAHKTSELKGFKHTPPPDIEMVIADAVVTATASQSPGPARTIYFLSQLANLEELEEDIYPNLVEPGLSVYRELESDWFQYLFISVGDDEIVRGDRLVALKLRFGVWNLGIVRANQKGYYLMNRVGMADPVNSMFNKRIETINGTKAIKMFGRICPVLLMTPSATALERLRESSELAEDAQPDTIEYGLHLHKELRSSGRKFSLFLAHKELPVRGDYLQIMKQVFISHWGFADVQADSTGYFLLGKQQSEVVAAGGIKGGDAWVVAQSRKEFLDPFTLFGRECQLVLRKI